MRVRSAAATRGSKRSDLAGCIAPVSLVPRLRPIVLIASILVLTDVISDSKSLRVAVGSRGRRASSSSLPGMAAGPHDPLPAAEADRVAVGVGEHADPHLGRDSTWRAALGRPSREEARAAASRSSTSA